MWHTALVTPDDAAAYLDEVRRSGRSGVRRMEAWLEKTAARSRPSQSRTESDFVGRVERAGLPTSKRQHPLRLVGGEVVHLDIAWPDIQPAVEPGHSWWHGGDLAQRRDQARDRACSAVGWLVVRDDESARRDPTVAGELVAIHRQRTADRR